MTKDVTVMRFFSIIDALKHHQVRAVIGNNNQTASEVLRCLRQATGELHKRLDASLPLAQPDADTAAYLGHLQMLHSWLQVMTDRIERCGGQAAAFGNSVNQLALGFLVQDLADAGMTPLPVAQVQPALSRMPFAYGWGMQYVIEGSYLGASMLYKCLQPRFSSCHMHFFRHASSVAKERWPQFCSLLAENVQGKQAIAEAEKGAITAFEHFIALSSVKLSNTHADLSLHRA